MPSWSDESTITAASLTAWCAKLERGDSLATQRLWDRYFHRMVGIARNKLAGAPSSARDEEDVAISAFKSFCMGMQENRIQAPGEGVNLWPLLVRVTLNKAIDQIRAENRQKRGGTGRAGEVKRKIESLDVLEHVSGAAQQPELELAAAESLEILLDRLDETGDTELRSLVHASMQGETLQSMADALGCSTRTIQRKLKTIRAIWESA